MVATTLALLGAGAVSSVATSKKDPTDSIKSKQAYARTGKVDE
jgi:hypothetical protein